MTGKSNKLSGVLGLILYPLLWVLLYYLMTLRFTFLVWIFLIPLFFFIKKFSYKQIVLFYGPIIISGSLWIFSWLKKYDPDIWISLSIIFGSYFIISGLITKLLFDNIKNQVALILIIPIIWIGLALPYEANVIGNFWLNFSMYQPTMAPLIWYLGGWGITFFIIQFSYLLYLGVEKKWKNGKINLLVVASFGAILFCNVFC